MSKIPTMVLFLVLLNGCVSAPPLQSDAKVCNNLQKDFHSEQNWSGIVAPILLGGGLVSTGFSLQNGLRDDPIGPPELASTPVLITNAIVLGAGLYLYKRQRDAARAEASIYRLNAPTATQCRQIYADFKETF